MKTTRMALAFACVVIAIVGCAHLASDDGKRADTHYLTLRHTGFPSNPNQAAHPYRHIKWWLNEGTGPGFGIHVNSNEWIEWHNPKEPNFAIAVRHANQWKPEDGLKWLSIPNLGTWPAVATTNGRVRMQFTPDADTKSGPINYRIAIPPASEIHAMEAPQSNYCDVEMVEVTVVFGGAFTNQMRGANERIQTR